MGSTFFGKMIIDSITTEIHEFQAEQFKISPNPFTNYCTVSSGKSFKEVTIFNMLLDEVFHKSFAPTRIYSFNCENLNTGIYLLKVSYGKYDQTVKLIKN